MINTVIERDVLANLYLKHTLVKLNKALSGTQSKLPTKIQTSILTDLDVSMESLNYDIENVLSGKQKIICKAIYDMVDESVSNFLVPRGHAITLNDESQLKHVYKIALEEIEDEMELGENEIDPTLNDEEGSYASGDVQSTLIAELINDIRSSGERIADEIKRKSQLLLQLEKDRQETKKDEKEEESNELEDENMKLDDTEEELDPNDDTSELEEGIEEEDKKTKKDEDGEETESTDDSDNEGGNPFDEFAEESVRETLGKFANHVKNALTSPFKKKTKKTAKFGIEITEDDIKDINEALTTTFHKFINQMKQDLKNVSVNGKNYNLTSILKFYPLDTTQLLSRNELIKKDSTFVFLKMYDLDEDKVFQIAKDDTTLVNKIIIAYMEVEESVSKNVLTPINTQNIKHLGLELSYEDDEYETIYFCTSEAVRLDDNIANEGVMDNIGSVPSTDGFKAIAEAMTQANMVLPKLDAPLSISLADYNKFIQEAKEEYCTRELLIKEKIAVCPDTKYLLDSGAIKMEDYKLPFSPTEDTVAYFEFDRDLNLAQNVNDNPIAPDTAEPADLNMKMAHAICKIIEVLNDQIGPCLKEFKCFRGFAPFMTVDGGIYIGALTHDIQISDINGNAIVDIGNESVKDIVEYIPRAIRRGWARYNKKKDKAIVVPINERDQMAQTISNTFKENKEAFVSKLKQNKFINACIEHGAIKLSVNLNADNMFENSSGLAGCILTYYPEKIEVSGNGYETSIKIGNQTYTPMELGGNSLFKAGTGLVDKSIEYMIKAFDETIGKALRTHKELDKLGISLNHISDGSNGENIYITTVKVKVTEKDTEEVATEAMTEYGVCYDIATEGFLDKIQLLGNKISNRGKGFVRWINPNKLQESYYQDINMDFIRHLEATKGEEYAWDVATFHLLVGMIAYSAKRWNKFHTVKALTLKHAEAWKHVKNGVIWYEGTDKFPQVGSVSTTGKGVAEVVVAKIDPSKIDTSEMRILEVAEVIGEVSRNWAVKTFKNFFLKDFGSMTISYEVRELNNNYIVVITFTPPSSIPHSYFPWYAKVDKTEDVLYSVYKDLYKNIEDTALESVTALEDINSFAHNVTDEMKYIYSGLRRNGLSAMQAERLCYNLYVGSTVKDLDEITLESMELDYSYAFEGTLAKNIVSRIKTYFSNKKDLKNVKKQAEKINPDDLLAILNGVENYINNYKNQDTFQNTLKTLKSSSPSLNTDAFSMSGEVRYETKTGIIITLVSADIRAAGIASNKLNMYLGTWAGIMANEIQKITKSINKYDFSAMYLDIDNNRQYKNLDLIIPWTPNGTRAVNGLKEVGRMIESYKNDMDAKATTSMEEYFVTDLNGLKYYAFEEYPQASFLEYSISVAYEAFEDKLKDAQDKYGYESVEFTQETEKYQRIIKEVTTATIQTCVMLDILGISYNKKTLAYPDLVKR